MPNKLETLLSQINVIIRQQVNKDSITPETTAGILDLIANFANVMDPFQWPATEEGYLMADIFIGMNIGCIIGNGVILDGTIQFSKIEGDNFVGKIDDPENPYEFTAGYPYTIIPIL